MQNDATTMQRSGQVTGKGGEIILYKAKDGRTSLDVRLEQDSVWLSQKQMAVLFGKDTDTIGLHIRNAYNEKELLESATAEESSVVQQGRQAPGRQCPRRPRL